MKNKLLNFDQLKSLKSKYKNSKFVHCHGVFDLLHYGHLDHFKSAKTFGDVLIVSITTDAHVNKGPNRPINNQEKRAEMLTSLEIVDFVFINNTKNAVQVIKTLKPDFYVKGPDYAIQKNDITNGISIEEEAVISIGGKLVITEDDTQSSTKLINQFFNTWNKDQKTTIEKIKNNFSISEILNILDKLNGLKILVTGEPIIDTYISVIPQNISSKSPSVSANFTNEKNFTGGSLAVAKHLSSLGCDVTLCAPIGKEEYLKPIYQSMEQNSNLNLEIIKYENFNTPRKTRFIQPFKNQHIFELTNIDFKGWLNFDFSKWEERVLDLTKINELCIIMDFGHGLWEKNRQKLITQFSCFKSINIQTNSSNFGYNLFTKHKNYSYIALDERELRLGLQDQVSSMDDLLAIVKEKYIKPPFSITLGENGSVHVTENSIYTSPTYFSKPIDTTGAGDAFFALSSVLTYMKVPDILIPFLSNIFAGLKTNITGNEKPVDKIDFIKSIRALLG